MTGSGIARVVCRAVSGSSPVSRAGMSPSGALACCFALRVAAPRGLAAALAAAAPSEDIPTLLPARSCNCSDAKRRDVGSAVFPSRGSAPSEARHPAQTRRASDDAHGTRGRTTSPRATLPQPPLWRTGERQQNGARCLGLSQGGEGCPLRERPQPAPLQGGAVQRAERRRCRRELPKGTSLADHARCAKRQRAPQCQGPCGPGS